MKAWLELMDRTAVREAGQRTQIPKQRAEPLEIKPEKAEQEPGMERLETLVLTSRRRLRGRMVELLKGRTA